MYQWGLRLIMKKLLILLFSILISFNSYGETVTAEAIDMAIKNCAKYNKGMRPISSNAVTGVII